MNELGMRNQLRVVVSQHHTAILDLDEAESFGVEKTQRWICILLQDPEVIFLWLWAGPDPKPRLSRPVLIEPVHHLNDVGLLRQTGQPTAVLSQSHGTKQEHKYDSRWRLFAHVFPPIFLKKYAPR